MSSCSCLVIGDPHFQTSNVTSAEQLIERVNRAISTLHPDFVVILGDLLHTHEKIHVTPFNLATRLILSVAETHPLYLLIGNHDYCNNQQFLTRNHAFNSFKEIKNVTICDTVIKRTICGYDFIFTPYVPPGRFKEALATVEDGEWSDVKCIFAHQEFYGCRFNPVMTSVDGDVWEEEMPMVVSGHIHNEQMLQKNIYYTGSSMQHAFGESANKIIALCKFSDKKAPSIKRINLQLRKKKILYMNINEVTEFEMEKNTDYKIVVKGETEEFKVFRKSLMYKKLQEAGIAISFTPVKREGDKDIVAVATEENSTTQNVLDILDELIDHENTHMVKSFNILKRL